MRTSVWGKISQEDWNDWRWQFRNRVQTVEDVERIVQLTEDERTALTARAGFVVGVTPYFVSLMDRYDPNCPIRRQVLPSTQELEPGPHGLWDPLGEENESPVESIIHRYPDRVVLLVTETCHMYCRHCTRRRLVGFQEGALPSRRIRQAVDYVREHDEIRDVLISGGDPLSLSDSELESIISSIRQIEHVEVIRIGTRAPVTNPFRVTPSLLRMLSKHHPIWINIQFNHPKEITSESTAACARIVDAGIPLGNQSVLLRGINDTVETQKQLVHNLVRMRIRPYYLYQCDLAEGIEHFRTPVARGIEIMENLRGHTSGFAVPTFVIDAPGGGGKIPVLPNYVISQTPETVVLRTFEGKIIHYPEPLAKFKKSR